MIPRNRAYGDSCNFIGGGLYPLCGYAMVALHKGYNSRLYRNQSEDHAHGGGEENPKNHNRQKQKDRDRKTVALFCQSQIQTPDNPHRPFLKSARASSSWPPSCRSA